jgi:tRNA A-37 threonylcarbamoyl transferase component Bud32
MTEAAEIDVRLTAFLSGKLTFDRLVGALRALAGRGGPGVVGERLRDFVNTGRLPPDLAALILADLSRSVPPPTGSEKPAAEVPVNPAAAPLDPLRTKVDEVVLAALVADFKGLRDKRRTVETSDDRGLDSMLTDFRSARLRRDAATAVRNDTTTRSPTHPPVAHEAEIRAPAAGEMLKDRFVLDRELGRGGMGTVFRAVDRRRLEARHAHPYVAIKLLNNDFRRHPEAFRALEAEARKAQELSHPNIVTVYDFDRDGHSVFIVMELLEGEPLDDVLHANPQGLGQAAFPVIDGICAGLAHAHARGVVHADLKPANVFVCADQIVKLLDFGIATAAKGSGFDAASLLSYTPAYASPEILRNDGRHASDDVFALGILAYELYCGVHPFDRKSADKAQRERMQPKRPAGLSSRAWQTIEKALAFDGKRRPADAAVFAQGLAATGLLGRIWRP